MTYRCVKCGEPIKKEVEGSSQHPYCKKCFKAVWDDNYDKYFEWLENGGHR